uniref:Uncharacterized protein n=1 Tax=Daphnia galeata TaxID=27404 RepID=A0A8J2WL33_9CRUS|nr:unnamed protein product [Daphnia galeata]
MKVLAIVAFILVVVCVACNQLPDGWNYNLFFISFFSLVRSLPLGLEEHAKKLATYPDRRLEVDCKRKETQNCPLLTSESTGVSTKDEVIVP